jgi:hypothetical protein
MSAMKQYIYLYNKIVMMLREIKVPQCASKLQQVLAVGSTNSAYGESAKPSAVFIFMKMQI